MEIMRVSGKGGVQCYDAGIWTLDEARRDYTEQTGEESDSLIQHQIFDALSGKDLVSFINNGCP